MRGLLGSQNFVDGDGGTGYSGSKLLVFWDAQLSRCNFRGGFWTQLLCLPGFHLCNTRAWGSEVRRDLYNTNSDTNVQLIRRMRIAITNQRFDSFIAISTEYVYDSILKRPPLFDE